MRPGLAALAALAGLARPSHSSARSGSTAPAPGRPSDRVRFRPRAAKPSRSPRATGPTLSIAEHSMAVAHSAVPRPPFAPMRHGAFPRHADASPHRPRLNGVCLELLVGCVPPPPPSFDVLLPLHAGAVPCLATVSQPRLRLNGAWFRPLVADALLQLAVGLHAG